MRVKGVIVGEPAGQLDQEGRGVGLPGEAGVVALDGLHERFGHVVGLRDGRGHGFQAKITGEAAGLERGVG